MKAKFFLYVNNRGSVRAVKNGSRIQGDEVEIGVTLTLPDALFNRPVLQANIQIPDEAALPQVIDANVIENVKDAIKTATNLEFNIQVGVQEESDTDLNN